MIKIGMLIGDRYEILEKIGAGGMSDVFKAKCHKLNRFVAVKVLKQEFAENPDFVSKFKIEAQAAAGLMHPNIVNVYDVGEEGGINYIVMELVEGITLKKYIQKKIRISYKEAVSIAIQVAMGIEAAHNNHIIHRDIKPQNIIISRDGKVKVTDFGIAKATTSRTITSNVMGSVHYTSPEQARGGYSDQKSDVYSLGITLFEMLTGRVPFAGDTTVAIAIKHIQEELPSPTLFAQEIPFSVEQIVLKCCHKIPDSRYASMGKLIVDLKQSLVTPDDDFVETDNPESEMATRAVTDSEIVKIKQSSRLRSGSIPQEEMTGYEEQVSPEGYLGESEDLYGAYEEEEEYFPEDQGEYEEDEYDEYDYIENPKMEKIVAVLAVLVGIVIIVVLVLIVIRITGNLSTITTPRMTQESSSDPIESTATSEQVLQSPVATGDTDELVLIPDVRNWAYEEALLTLTNLGFTVNKTEAFSELIGSSRIINQSPGGGERATAGSEIDLTVSQGSQVIKVEVPDIRGLLEQEGKDRLLAASLKVGEVTSVYSKEYEVGTICYQSFSVGSMIPEDTSVDISISLGEGTATYYYEGHIEAPTIQEAPDYVTGTPVYVKLVSDDGVIIKEATITSFPEPAYFYNIGASAGTITLTYQVNEPPTSTVNADGQIVTIPGDTIEKVVQRRVEFTQEG
ncbi:MAG: Stk1 family PASTA domain-containing Ser/Thr kinase [Lachnospiraceae bacterium]|jgi:serine/threonine-protein kinase|nr:Stk1 family PASTA domain-containing Ser/Thr kinase [Lachnospiraceae bacterium]